MTLRHLCIAAGAAASWAIWTNAAQANREQLPALSPAIGQVSTQVVSAAGPLPQIVSTGSGRGIAYAEASNANGLLAQSTASADNLTAARIRYQARVIASPGLAVPILVAGNLTAQPTQTPDSAVVYASIRVEDVESGNILYTTAKYGETPYSLDVNEVVYAAPGTVLDVTLDTSATGGGSCEGCPQVGHASGFLLSIPQEFRRSHPGAHLQISEGTEP
jgi:hypothetical protein